MQVRAWPIGTLAFMSFGAMAGARADASPQPRQDLQYFEGSWHCNGVFPASGRKISSNLKFTWYPVTGAVLKQHDDEPPNGYHALELWVPAGKGGLQNMIGDSFGGARLYISSGWVNDSMTWLDNNQRNQKEEFVYTRIDSDTLRIDWMIAKNGGPFILGDTLTCARTIRGRPIP